MREVVKNCLQKLGWYLQLEECSMFRQSERIQIYSQSSQTPLTDCFTLTGSSEGNLNNIQHCKNYIVNVTQIRVFKKKFCVTFTI